jgi:hypothetical protein
MVELYGGFVWWFFMIKFHDRLIFFEWWLLKQRAASNKTVEEG